MQNITVKPLQLPCAENAAWKVNGGKRLPLYVLLLYSACKGYRLVTWFKSFATIPTAHSAW